MAKKKTAGQDPVVKELSDELKTKEVFLGTEETLKKLGKGEVSKVYMASNVEEFRKEEVEKYAKLAEIDIVALPLNNEQLGVLCKKPYSVAVLSVKK